MAAQGGGGVRKVTGKGRAGNDFPLREKKCLIAGNILSGRTSPFSLENLAGHLTTSSSSSCCPVRSRSGTRRRSPEAASGPFQILVPVLV